MSEQPENITLQTYRFIFSKEFTEELAIFAKVHQYDERKHFKEEWTNWINDEQINPIINEEVKNLRNNGFEGDIMSKMFKSARYYYRKKSSPQEREREKDEETKKERKPYESIPRERMEKIDAHIYSQINMYAKIDNNKKVSKISPGESFQHFLQENKEEILNELRSTNIPITKEECETLLKKYKKTYKNRFYNIRVAMNKTSF
jgi:hypothetical protein